MFESLTDRISHTFRNLMGRAKLSEDNIKGSIREIREALLSADVALPVVKEFIRQVQEKAIGHEITKQLSPAQVFIKIVNEELTTLLAGEDGKNNTINLSTVPPAVILMAGLQGSGKTTTVAKLAYYLKNNLKKSVLLASLDIYRPAAIDQLRILAAECGVPFFETTHKDPVVIAKEAYLAAKKQGIEVLILDTAGRLHIDEPMMQEIKKIHSAVNPIETLFVVDSMTGQDAAKTARAFHEALPLTGVILTKTDGDARGGAALSVRSLTGKPIKFMGVGEKIEALEPFYPDRVASRILGMGDMLSLIEEVERNVDKAKAEKLAKKLQKGQGFDLADLRDQMKQMLSMGGITNIMDKLPGMGHLPQAVKSKVNNKEIVRTVAILDSMTQSERHQPALVANSGSRKRRIAQGSGTQLQEVNRVLKQHEQMQKMMKKFTNKGSMMQLMKSLSGKLPPGMLPPNMMPK